MLDLSVWWDFKSFKTKPVQPVNSGILSHFRLHLEGASNVIAACLKIIVEQLRRRIANPPCHSIVH
jgi:hypothetical protein